MTCCRLLSSLSLGCCLLCANSVFCLLTTARRPLNKSSTLILISYTPSPAVSKFTPTASVRSKPRILRDSEAGEKKQLQHYITCQNIDLGVLSCTLIVLLRTPYTLTHPHTHANSSHILKGWPMCPWTRWCRTMLLGTSN
jgi:hypothetical protein